MEEDREKKVRPFSHRKSPSKFFKKWYYTCPLASLFLLTIIIIVLSLTIFKVKDPIITMNNIKVTKLDTSPNNNSTPMLLPKLIVKLTADVSIKNPNVASFRYSNTTTTLYYHGVTVGEAWGPPGKARARRTMRMNVTIDVVPDKLLSNPDFMNDLLGGGKGVVRMDSFSRVPGQVKILNFIKKHVVVKMNCSSNYSVFNQQMQEMDCKRKVKIW